MTDTNRADSGQINLAAYAAAEPPPGFADRVIAARDETASIPVGAPSTADANAGNPVLRKAAIAVGIAAVAVVVGALSRGARIPPASGAIVATERTTARLGMRGVAVAQPGASLRWEVSRGGATRVDHTAGDAFYRVDVGGPFVVRTPAGDVTVTGTCFSVEVEPMKPSKQALTGAAVGAALSATVLLTVYEGSVLFANDAGTTEAIAGQTVVAHTGAPPIAVVADDPASPVVAVAVEPPADDVTRDELLARDEALRAEIARLRKQVEASAGGEPVVVRRKQRGGGGGIDDDDWFDPTPEQLADFAEDCRVRIDAPPVFGPPLSDGMAARMAERLNLSDAEAAKMFEALKGFQARAEEEIRALYVEATGDVDGASQLSIRAMSGELRDKAAPGEDGRVRRKIANERAGFTQPPASVDGLSPYERYFRMLAASGDDFEAVMAEIVGPERAKELRRDGPSMRMDAGGCPGDGAGGDEDVDM